MEQFYNKHYIKVDSSNRVVEGWSDGPHREKDTTDAICINDKGGYQFKLFYYCGTVMQRTEENPPLFDWNGMIPLYKWDGDKVLARSIQEIEADRVEEYPTPAQQREQAYNTETIVSWSGEMITVTQAAQLWQYYAAEGNEKATELQALIAEAKATIREKYPD